MKKSLPLYVVFLYLLLTNFAFAGPLSISGDDTVQTVLASQKGTRVTVKLKSGDELTGKVGEVNDNLVSLHELSGKEFFDAAINLKNISAVIIRAKE